MKVVSLPELIDSVELQTEFYAQIDINYLHVFVSSAQKLGQAISLALGFNGDTNLGALRLQLHVCGGGCFILSTSLYYFLMCGFNKPPPIEQCSQQASKDAPAL